MHFLDNRQNKAGCSIRLLMLAAKRPVGVTPQVILRNSLHTGDKAYKLEIHPPWIRNPRLMSPKVKTKVGVTSQKNPKKFLEKCQKMVAEHFRPTYLETYLHQFGGGGWWWLLLLIKHIVCAIQHSDKFERITDDKSWIFWKKFDTDTLKRMGTYCSGCIEQSHQRPRNNEPFKFYSSQMCQVIFTISSLNRTLWVHSNHKSGSQAMDKRFMTFSLAWRWTWKLSCHDKMIKRSRFFRWSRGIRKGRVATSFPLPENLHSNAVFGKNGLESSLGVCTSLGNHGFVTVFKSSVVLLPGGNRNV